MLKELHLPNISTAMKRTEITELGEFGLIEKLTSTFINKNNSSVSAIGDDAAVLQFENKQILVSTDMLIEGIHFDLTFHPLKHLGYKAVVVNISDIYAMNGKPTQITVSMGISNRFSLEALQELYEGIALACQRYGVDLVGGDTCSSKQGLIISITAIGVAEKDLVVYRNGAKEGDLICVSGDLGAAYLGLQILEREKRVFFETKEMQPDLEGFDYLLERQLKPEAAKSTIDLLESLQILPTAMIDISDGLSSELHHLSKKSGVGVVIYENKLPFHQQTTETAEMLNIDPSVCALNGGEDYELLFTVKQEDYEKLKDTQSIHIIGYCADISEGLKLITRNNNTFDIKAQGWMHY